MRIVFFGTSEFALPSLKRLMESSYKPLAVVSQPDRRKGRHLLVSEPAVKTEALNYSLPVYQPESLSNLKIITALRNLEPELFVVVSYGQILKKEILEIPSLFPINLHASLLPRYRGAAPINWAIMNGEKKTGVTIIKMNEYMDQGQIILQKEVRIEKEDDALTLSNRLSHIGARVLMEALDLIQMNKATFLSQNEGEASYARKLKKQDGLIHWHNSSLDIHNRIRGTIPWPGAYTYYRGKLLKIWRSEFSLSKSPLPDKPGTILKASKEGILVVCGRGSLLIKELQLEGKRRLKVEEFISGYRINPKESLG